MSLLLTAEEGWIISHIHYLNDIYKHVQHEQQSKTLKFKESFFKITSPYLRQNQRKKLDEQSHKLDSNEYFSSKKRKKTLCKLSRTVLEQVNITTKN